MSIYKIEKVFSDKEIKYLNQIIYESKQDPDPDLGRVKRSLDLPYFLISPVTKSAGLELSLSSACYVKYSKEYGNPNLPPHFDADDSDIIVNYQLSSNISWGVGTDLQLNYLEDNSAIVFNPNKHIHWRPIKEFQDGEYLEMIFFRYCDLKNRKNNSNLNFSSDNIIYKEVNDYRNSINNISISEAKK